MLDAILVVLLLGYALSGFRQGAVVGVLSVAGFLGGGALAMWLVPSFLPESLTAADASVRRVVLLLTAVIICATLGQAAAVAVGVRIRSRVRLDSLRLADSIFGSVASIVAVAVLVGLVAGAVRGGPSASLTRAVGQSKVIAAIDQIMPASSARVFAGFRTLLDVEGFPRVFEGFGPERIRPVAPPDASSLGSPAVQRAAGGVVKITGTAKSCRRTQEGSGWVYRSGVVITNAHVVAGVKRPSVQVGGVGRQYPASVVVFDPVRDLAVLNVPDFPAAPLSLGKELSADDSGSVAGYPLNGPYRVDPARVREVITARGEDIYARSRSIRQVYSLNARVQPGNSGGPLLDTAGRVVGVVFAKSLDDDSTGYALTLAEAAPVLKAGSVPRQPVDVGPCTTG